MGGAEEDRVPTCTSRILDVTAAEGSGRARILLLLPMSAPLAALVAAASGWQVGSPRCAGATPRSPPPALAADGVTKLDKVRPGELDKRAERRRIMSQDKYKRGNAPFERSTHTAVAEKMSQAFASDLVQQMKEGTTRELVKGEGSRAITFQLAQEYGFCWGVERSIELAWAARDAYPDRPMHITNELIHNPGVNGLLKARGGAGWWARDGRSRGRTSRPGHGHQLHRADRGGEALWRH